MSSIVRGHNVHLPLHTDDDDDIGETREGWETISMDGQIIGIRTSTIDEKCQAFDTLVVYCATLGGRFAPYLTQSLELSLPALKFYFHDGVREAASRCVLSGVVTVTANDYAQTDSLAFHVREAERNTDIADGRCFFPPAHPMYSS